MNEGTRTLSYVGAALLVLIVAVASRPRPPQGDPDDPQGRVLNQVDDPLTATSLEVVKFEEDTSSIRDFSVAKKSGRWVIPSHHNYPADAEQQMADAATGIMNLKILRVASDTAGDHELYGVIEPDVEKLSVGSQGVGTQVTMKDQEGDELVNMIIGKTDKDQDDLRFVREAGRDPVYVVKLDPSKLSTDFGNWIEKDLLKLAPFDIQGLTLNDYSVSLQLTSQGVGLLQDRRSEIDLDYDETDSKWSVSRLVTFDKKTQEPQETPVASEEELDITKLDDLKTALDDLKIVDVERKPEGLSQDLRVETDFVKNQEAARSLADRGFVPVMRDDAVEILSSEGEVICEMKDGVEYVMRFGRITLGPDSGSQAKEGDEETKQGAGINRYLFVTARFNESLIPKPKLQELPEAPAEEPPAAEAPAADADKATAEDTKAAGDAEDAEADVAKTEVDEERAKIEKQNRRKLDEYNEKVTKGKEHAKELNARFGDWYYVISDDVYRKIHLGRDDLFKKKEAPQDETAAENDLGINALDAIQQQGLPQAAPE